jgi:hypothetical protein
VLYNVGIYDWEDIILKRYSVFSIFCFYIGGKLQIGVPINSPLRKDENPSFALFKTLTGDIMFKDFSTGEAGGWVKFIQMKFDLSYRSAIAKAFVDLILTNKDIPEGYITPHMLYEKKNTTIGIKLASFRQADLKYWKQFNIDNDLLNLYNVVAVSDVWVNNQLVLNRNGEDLMFAYLINNRIKVYSPLANRRYKWIGNTDLSCIFGYSQLPIRGNLLIITKALKDVMTLKSFGYEAVAGNSETSLLKESTIIELKERFERIIVFLDNDEAGINAAKKYQEKYNLDYVIVPDKYECKDISDFVKKYTNLEWVIQKLNNLLTNVK